MTAQLLGTGDALDLGEQRLRTSRRPSGSSKWAASRFRRCARPDRRDSPAGVEYAVLGTPGGDGRAPPAGRGAPRRRPDGTWRAGEDRLAAHVAQQLVDEFPYGIDFIGLAGISAEATDNAIADGIGVRGEPDRSVPESVVAWLGDRRVLLFPENCEEVVLAAAERSSRSCATARRSTCWSRVVCRSEWSARSGCRSSTRSGRRRRPLRRSRCHRGPGARPGSCGRGALPASGWRTARAGAGGRRCRTLTPHELLIRLERTPEVLTDATGIFIVRDRDLDRLIKGSWHGCRHRPTSARPPDGDDRRLHGRCRRGRGLGCRGPHRRRRTGARGGRGVGAHDPGGDRTRGPAPPAGTDQAARRRPQR